MPLLQKSVQLAGKAMPKIASPKAHAVLDYAVAAIFFAGAILFWRRNKRAAVASLACGAAQAGVAALTDSPGGVKPVISFPLRKKIDFGLSSLAATMPQFLAFEDDREKTFFRVQSLVIAGLTAVTEFKEQPIAGERQQRAA